MSNKKCPQIDQEVRVKENGCVGGECVSKVGRFVCVPFFLSSFPFWPPFVSANRSGQRQEDEDEDEEDALLRMNPSPSFPLSGRRGEEGREERIKGAVASLGPSLPLASLSLGHNLQRGQQREKGSLDGRKRRRRHHLPLPSSLPLA